MDKIEASLLPIPPLSIDDFVRFISKVEKTETCWLWKAGKSGGYGSFRLLNVHYKSHRVSWRWHKKVDPGHNRVLHTCNTPLCVNPEHLFLGSHSENMKQAFDSGRNSISGILNPRATFQESDVKAIRALSKAGISPSKIQAAYPWATVGAVQNVINYRTWRHLV